MWSYLLSDLAPAAAGARSLHILDKSTFGEGGDGLTDNEVIENPDVDQRKRFLKASRD
jgi:hypothetical protein